MDNKILALAPSLSTPASGLKAFLLWGQIAFLVAKKRVLIYLMPHAILAQLVEHLICNQAVSSSSLLDGSIN